MANILSFEHHGRLIRVKRVFPLNEFPSTEVYRAYVHGAKRSECGRSPKYSNARSAAKHWLIVEQLHDRAEKVAA